MYGSVDGGAIDVPLVPAPLGGALFAWSRERVQHSSDGWPRDWSYLGHGCFLLARALPLYFLLALVTIVLSAVKSNGCLLGASWWAAFAPFWLGSALLLCTLAYSAAFVALCGPRPKFVVRQYGVALLMFSVSFALLVLMFALLLCARLQSG
jgi:hypothetical protein